MKVVTVQQLGDSLENCLAAVKSGEDVLVTDLGKPIAKLVAATEEVEDERARLERLAQAGVRRGTGFFPEGFWNLPLGKPKEGCSVLEALLDDRRKGR